MSFYNALNKTLGDEFNYSKTENGASGFRTTQSALLDINFKVASYRSMSDNKIVDDFMKAFFEDKVLAMKWLFFARDIRGGLGERRLFRVIMKYLAETQKDIVIKLLDLFAEYGRYDDLIILLNTPVANDVINIIKTTLENDMNNMKSEKSITLMGKWLPSANTSSKETCKLAQKVIKGLSITEKQYRKMLSALRKYTNVIEVKMSNREWNDIDYNTVPSRANLIYNGAFLRNDENRRREYLSALEKGEAKINAGTLYPHDIVHKYVGDRCYKQISNIDIALEQMWKSLPDYIQGDDSSIVVADGSGSMESNIGGTNVTALSVANALAIYFAERAKGDFKNKYITFSERPQLVNLTGSTLKDNIEIALRYTEVANTNIEAVFDLILTTAINGKMNQSEIPKNIIIISDMEFDRCAVDNHSVGNRWNASLDKRLFEVISDKFKRAGYILPRLIFWNVSSRTGTIPVKENEMGVALVSGFSPSIAKMVLSAKTDPFEVLLETLNSERYVPVGEALE